MCIFRSFYGFRINLNKTSYLPALHNMKFIQLGTQHDNKKRIHHMDLYRLSGTSSQDFDSLDLTRVYSDCISLIEWPIRLKPFTHLLPEESRLLEIDIRIPDPISDERTMSLISSSHSSWTKRLNDLVDEGMLDDLLLYDEDGDDDDDDDDII